MDHLNETAVFLESDQDETNDAGNIMWNIFHDWKHLNFFSSSHSVRNYSTVITDWRILASSCAKDAHRGSLLDS